jgi:hypothetical protein
MPEEASRQLYPHPARPFIVLAIAPAIGLGILTDAMGDLSVGLNVSAAILVAGVAACMAYAALRPAPKPEMRNAALYPTQTRSRV